MKTREEWGDEHAQFDHRDASLLLDRRRRDLLAKITPDSVEAFSYLYEDYDRSNDLEQILCREMGLKCPEKGERIADHLIGWLDNILLLSVAGHGGRAKQLVQALRAAHNEERELGEDLDTGGRGLKGNNHGKD